MNAFSSDLKERVARGEYEVDPGAVAEAVMRKLCTAPRSAVLVPAEAGGELTIRGHELEPGARADLS